MTVDEESDEIWAQIRALRAWFDSQEIKPNDAVFVMAMTIQRQSGGNLSDVLERLANLLRERQRLQNHVKTLTAEGRLQAITLFCLPFVVFGGLMVVNRSYAVMLFENVRLLIATAVSMTLGMLWIRKIIDIKV